ncbi:MAG: dTDP-4-dehydrorhamnose 3,5-epimerase [Acidimicrobiaceae bacterium]|nr:dTDP-4-dehydrorhamnose 3,5-epimerase [Acidimicrobiaceae bacterium]
MAAARRPLDGRFRKGGPLAEVTPSAAIDGVLVVDLEVHDDDRGLFVETWCQKWLGNVPPMVQGNRADRVAGTVVGLHYHLHQADYWVVVAGRARVVLHDLRTGSPTDGATLVMDLGGDGPERHRGVYIPPGVAHGFAALSDLTITYLVDRTYDPSDELGVAWDDPAVGADWGVTGPVLSERDLANPARADLADDLRPVHKER